MFDTRVHCHVWAGFVFNKVLPNGLHSFWLLHENVRSAIIDGKEKITKEQQQRHSRQPERQRKKRKGQAPNGETSTVTHVSAANRYFAGGDHFDIALVHGISHCRSVPSVGTWFSVPIKRRSFDAIYQPKLDIVRPKFSMYGSMAFPIGIIIWDFYLAGNVDSWAFAPSKKLLTLLWFLQSVILLGSQTYFE